MDGKTGFEYNVVAVFGSQSTGKSALVHSCFVVNLIGTLLNNLFGTEFDVMNEKVRQQTTKGLIQSFSANEPFRNMVEQG